MGRPISLKIFQSFDDVSTYASAWDDLVLRSGADIYQMYDWCSVWWKHYGKDRDLSLFLGFEGDQLIGIFPAFVETLWIGPVWLRVAKLVGADFSLQTCNLAIEEAQVSDFLHAVLPKLFSEDSCDILVLGPLCGPNARIEKIVAAAERMMGAEVADNDKGCSSRFDLSNDFSKYLKAIGSRQRGNYSRGMKAMASSGELEVDVVMDHALASAEFDKFSSLHEEQWRQEGKGGHFCDWPGAMRFNRDLVDCFSKQGKIRFYRVLVDGFPVTSQYCFVSGNVNYWRLPARRTNREWENLSLGKLGLISMVEQAIKEGVTVIEGGRGHYEYKIQLGAHEWPLRTVEVFRSGPTVRVRVSTFRALAKALDFLYYRVFFLRIVPRFPWLGHALWSWWIRRMW